MGKKILIGCYEVPGYGGASTAAYKLFEIMQKDGFEVFFLNLIDQEDLDYFWYIYGPAVGNPKKLRNVINCYLGNPLFDAHPELAGVIRELSPDLLIGIDYIAALLMKRAAPKIKTIFLTAGCEQIKEYIATGSIRDFVSLQAWLQRKRRNLPTTHAREAAALLESDVIVCHSDIVYFLYNHFYPQRVTGKIYPDILWWAEWICKDALDYRGLRKPFSRRDIDVLFIASRWSRLEKNLTLVEEIVRECNNLDTHIVGETDHSFPQAKFHGLITDRRQLFELMGRTKTIVCTSLFDSAPGILFEASVLECNIVTSKNCGNWRLCNNQLLVDPYSLASFAEAINLSVTQRFPDNIEHFLESNSYRKLSDILLISLQ